MRRLDELLFSASVMIVDEVIGDHEIARRMFEQKRFDSRELIFAATLPRRVGRRIDYVFVRNLLASGFDLSSQLSRGWQGPGCMGQ